MSPIPDFTRYVPPGVYVEDVSQPVVTSTGLPGTTLVLVGPGQGSRTATESVLAWSTPDYETPLFNRGVVTTAVDGPPAIPAPVVTTLAGEVLEEDTDYEWVVDTSDGGGATNAVVSLRRLADGVDPEDPEVPSPNGVADGDVVVVTYHYVENDYYSPRLIDSYETILSTYGDALISTALASPVGDQVANPLSMAAKVAFENGVSEVLCVATDPEDGDLKEQFVAAYAKLLSDYRVGVIVPLFVDDYVTGTDTSDTHTPATLQGYYTDLKTHLETSAANGYGRIAVTGLVRRYDETDQTVDELAKWIGSKRVALAYPNRLSIYNGANNQTGEIDGLYLAAALGARLLVNPVQRGLTRQQIGSFSGIPSVIFQRMTKSFKDNLSKSGVLVIEQDRSSRLIVRHGVSTDMTAMTTREISLTRVADTLLQLVQTGMDAAGLIGQPIDYEMPLRVKGSLTGILEQARLNSIILDWTNLSVRQQALPHGDPSVIECRFSYKPAVPLNYITVAFSIDLSTGSTYATTAV